MKQQIFSINENAVTIDFGNEISVALNDKVLALDQFIEKNKFHGFIESVPAYSSLGVFFDLRKVRTAYQQFPTAFDFVKNYLENAVKNLAETEKNTLRIVKIPVNYDAAFAPDLEFVANCAKLSVEEVIKIHTGITYRVFMLGFLPAFVYLGEVDERIAAPRKLVPRTKIEAGSVGIAGRQTGIYPLESPGGWQIIGKTPVEIFTPHLESISLLQTGDFVKFHRLSNRT